MTVALIFPYVFNFDQTHQQAFAIDAPGQTVSGDYQCIHLPSAERMPKRNLHRQNTTTETGIASLLPLKLGFSSPVR